MRILKTLTLAGLLAAPFSAQAATQLVTNGDFETGTLAGWTCLGANYCAATGLYPHGGSYSVQAYDNVGYATLSQTLTTVAGSTYDLSFWSTSTKSSAANILSFSVAGAPAINVPVTKVNYVQTNYSFTATAASTVLSFFFETDPGTGVWLIDDVSVMGAALPPVAPIPLPASGLLLAGAIASAAGLRRRKA